MNSSITKYAAAAVIAAAVLIGFSLLSATPAWAIEQTIEALADIQGIYLSGVAHYPDNPGADFEMWARPHSGDASVSGDFRLHEGTHHVCVASESQNITFVYTARPWGDVVYLTEGINRHCQPFPTAGLFSLLKENATNWKEAYRKDPQTGRDSVFVSCKGFPVNTAPYWRLQFDLETKLPVRAGVWYTSDYSGQPHFDFTTIRYNPPMQEDLFEFAVPQAAQVVDCTEIRRRIDMFPDGGVNVDQLSTQDACMKIARDYWQAVFDENRSALKQIRPLTPDAEWDRISAVYEANKPVKFTQTKMNHLNDPATFAEVACMLTTQEGKTAQSVLLIDIRQTRSGKAGVVAGVAGPELTIEKE